MAARPSREVSCGRGLVAHHRRLMPKLRYACAFVFLPGTPSVRDVIAQKYAGTSSNPSRQSALFAQRCRSCVASAPLRHGIAVTEALVGAFSNSLEVPPMPSHVSVFAILLRGNATVKLQRFRWRLRLE